jgi:acetoin utilization deacetylase AcuC-like enzyme
MDIFYSEEHILHPYGLPKNPTGLNDRLIEFPERAFSILRALQNTSWAKIQKPNDFGLSPILQVHTPQYVDYLKSAYELYKCCSEEENVAFMPYTPGIPPEDLNHVNIPEVDGFFITNLHYAIHPQTFVAALEAAQCCLSAANTLINGSRVAFGLSRPPGHHAGKNVCGGFCYLNNAAIAAQWLSQYGKVTILDIDYHAGNGTQAIFYDRNDVFTISIHADPDRTWPKSAGHLDEIGTGPGRSYHRNYILPEGTDDELYLKTLEDVSDQITHYSPDFMVISAGFDTYIHDPLCDFRVTNDGFRRIGHALSNLNIPTAIVLEGGYNAEDLGENVVALLEPFQK